VTAGVVAQKLWLATRRRGYQASRRFYWSRSVILVVSVFESRPELHTNKHELICIMILKITLVDLY
jgi:hypothetical protein